MCQQVAVVHDIEAAPGQRVTFHILMGYGNAQLLQSITACWIGLKPHHFIPAGACGGEEEASPTADLYQPAMGTVSCHPSGLEFSRQGVKVSRMEVSCQIQRFHDGG